MGEEVILIVEDNEKNLELMRDVLAIKGFATLKARTAGEGISLARAHRPDLILMDIRLPDMDGLAALAQLREHAATADIPVVAVTAYAMAGDQERLLKAGFNGYLVKPVDIKTLRDQIREFLLAASRPDGT